VLDEGGRAVTLLDGHVTVLDRNGDADELVPVVDVPVTLGGLSRHNVENVLAAAGAAIAVASRGSGRRGAATFAADADANPGRMNVYDLAGVTVVVDLAHNEAGLQALVEVGSRVARARWLAPARARWVSATVRTTCWRGMGELAALRADDVVVGHKRKYLRDRTVEQMHALFGAGAAAAGLADLPACDDELAATQLLLGRAAAGDVVAVMCHEQRAEIHAALLAAAGHGGRSGVIRRRSSRPAEGSSDRRGTTGRGTSRLVSCRC
jgi:cyanophycin synthetase